MDKRQDRLYDLLPYVYRLRDAELGHPLRDLLQVIAEQVNLVEDNIAQLYDNWFIETAEDWVIPYLGDLVGYEAGEPIGLEDRPVDETRRIRSARADAANTIRYRRQRGTLAVLELLAQDAAGWSARAVEFYRLVAQTQALNHPHALRGRTADIRQGAQLIQLDGPFNEIAHTVDVRRINSTLTPGRYNSANVGLFVWRLKVRQVKQTPAAMLDERPNCFTFGILGNDVPLYLQPQPESGPDSIAEEWNLPVAIRRRAMDRWHKNGRLTEIYGPGDDKSLAIWAVYDDGKGKSAGESAPELILPEQIQVADLSNWHHTPKTPPRNQKPTVMVDPERGRIAFPERLGKNKTLVEVLVKYHYAQCDDIGGGTYPRPHIEAVAPATFSRRDLLTSGTPEEWQDELRSSGLELSRWFSPEEIEEYLKKPSEKQQDATVELLNRLLDVGEMLSEGGSQSTMSIYQDMMRRETRELWLKLIEDGAQDMDDVRLFNRLYLEDMCPGWLAQRSMWYVVQKAGAEGTFQTLQAALLQWSKDTPRTAVIEIADSGIYEEALTKIIIRDGQTLQIRAADQERPVIIIPEISHSQLDALIVEGEGSSHLILDGLLIAGRPLRIEGARWAEKPGDETDREERHMGGVTLRHCTLVPGWMPAPEIGEHSHPHRPKEYSLQLVYTSARAKIEHSIIGSIYVAQNEVLTDPILIQISDSIVDATDSRLAAIAGPNDRPAHAVLYIQRSTVIGSVRAHAFDLAENSIFDGTISLARRQRGCMRFCAYDPSSPRVPRRFNCQPDMAEEAVRADYEAHPDQYSTPLDILLEQVRLRLRPAFNNRQYGSPVYCQLAPSCAKEIKTGADDFSEMGVYHDLYQPQRVTNLQKRLDTFVPAGIDAAVILVN